MRTAIAAALLLLLPALWLGACTQDPGSANYAPLAGQRPDPAQVGGAGAGSM